MINIVKREIEKAWANSAPLTFTAVLMLASFFASVGGMLIDNRIITGVPAWLKPAKFAISSGIYAGTIAWLYQYVTVWPSFRRAMGWVIALVLVLEVGIIDLQAARGTTSHFNAATPLDAALFGVMGTAIVVLWLASIGVVAALFRQQFSDRTWGWALRLGLLISVLGAGAGGFMLGPKSGQLATMPPKVIGGHTVGAPDGGPGLPGVGWSTEHGDLRIPHFFGLHAVQVLPLLVMVMRRRRVASAFAAAGSYLGFIGILTWQAMRGQSIVQPDAITLTALAIWAVLSVIVIVACGFRSSRDSVRFAAIA